MAAAPIAPLRAIRNKLIRLPDLNKAATPPSTAAQPKPTNTERPPASNRPMRAAAAEAIVANLHFSRKRSSMSRDRRKGANVAAPEKVVNRLSYSGLPNSFPRKYVCTTAIRSEHQVTRISPLARNHPLLQPLVNTRNKMLYAKKYPAILTADSG